MSKAFTKEDDGGSDDDGQDESPELKIPAGSKNYVTPFGAERMKAELKNYSLKSVQSLSKSISWAASNGDRSENGDYIYGKRRLRQIDSRIRFLSKRIERFEVINPGEVKSDRILFGATVTIADEEGSEKTYQIVGLDETNPQLGKVSWISPIARCLMNNKVGDVVSLKTPLGEKELEITRIQYV